MITKRHSVLAIAAVLSVGIVTGCSMSRPGSAAIAAQQNDATDRPHSRVAEVTASQSSYVPNSTNSSAGPGILTDADITQQIEADKQSIRAGQNPPSVIKYDLEIAHMMPEARSLLAAHDKARARVWESKYRAIVEARNKAVADFFAPLIAQNNAIANVYASERATRPAPPQQQTSQSRGLHICGAGEAVEGRGGNGEPLCN